MNNTYCTIPQTELTVPVIGFGTGTKWQWKKKAENPISDENPSNTDPELVDSLVLAIRSGFTHLDTAEFYTTRPDVGEAIQKAIDDPTTPIKSRDELFVADKYNGRLDKYLPNGEIRGPYNSMKECLRLMKLDYIDLFLIHEQYEPEWMSLEQMWKEMVQLKNEGLVKTIGVSNYTVELLERVKATGLEAPQVLQIEFHPYLQDQSPGIREYCQKNGILLEAYGPLVPLTKARNAWDELIEQGQKPEGSEPPLEPVLRELSAKYGKSETQILLKYAHKHQFITITTSSKAERMKDILSVFEWELSDEDVQKIDAAGNSWFYRAFDIPPLPNYNEELKTLRGL
ncbi:hypothetical protein DAMA08_016050 [Martiniozyma asiatica (nom. inval.)]|nr:hypothetical protein DAMA08_016050 [Martiniozyma asiatica]